MASLIHATAHGLVANSPFQFSLVVPDNAGVDLNTTYYVLATGLTANDFQFSTTIGGTAFVLTYPITDGTLVGPDSYSVVNDGIMSPPAAPAAPGSCVLSSAAVVAPDGTTVSRLDITITQPTSATLLNTVVTVTGGSNAVKVIIPKGQTTGSIATVVPGLTYTGSAVAYDTYGLSSTPTVSAGHVAVGDVTAPAQVTGAVGYAGILAVSASWNASASTDLAYYELQIADNVGFVLPDTYKVATTRFTIEPVIAGIWNMRIRAVDLSGNAGSYSSTVNATARLTDVVSNSTAKVTIDPTGLTIQDGALILKDEFAKTAMVASGFAGNWLDFLGTGLYNGRFLSGSAGAVGLGRTSALPYWTVANVAGTATATLLTGGGVKFTFGALADRKRLTSDLVSVRPDVEYSCPVAFSAVVAVSGLVYSPTILWYQGDGVTPSATASTSLGSGGATVTVAAHNEDGFLATAPTDAVFAKVQIEVYQNPAHSASNSLTLLAAGIKEAPPRGLENVAAGRTWQMDDLFVNNTLETWDLVVENLATVTDPTLNGVVSSHGTFNTFTISGGGTATFSSKGLEWVQIGKVVTFKLFFNVSANGSGATSVTLSGMTGLPSPAVTCCIWGDRAGVGVTVFSIRFTSGPAISRILTLAGSTLTGADLLNGAGYTVSGSYLTA